MKAIQITDGLCDNNIINGLFELARAPRLYTPAKVASGFAKEGFDAYARIMVEGAKKAVHLKDGQFKIVDTETVEGAVSVATSPTKQEITPEFIQQLDDKIARRFKVMDIMCAGVVKGNVRGLIISGAPGVGKTFTFERELKAAHESGEVEYFQHIKGKMTPLYLFQQLWNARHKGSVLLLDDCDSVFGDETALNLLKGALDSSSERWITYGSAAKWLEEQGVEPHFEFKGQIVFITNYNFDDVINAGGKFAPHFSALISRSTYLSLAIHGKTEVMVRVAQVARETSIMADLGVDPETAVRMVQFCWDNYNKMRELSIRTLVKLAEYAQIGDWEFLAQELLIA